MAGSQESANAFTAGTSDVQLHAIGAGVLGPRGPMYGLSSSRGKRVAVMNFDIQVWNCFSVSKGCAASVAAIRGARAPLNTMVLVSCALLDKFSLKLGISCWPEHTRQLLHTGGIRSIRPPRGSSFNSTFQQGRRSIDSAKSGTLRMSGTRPGLDGRMSGRLAQRNLRRDVRAAVQWDALWEKYDPFFAIFERFFALIRTLTLLYTPSEESQKKIWNFSRKIAFE